MSSLKDLIIPMAISNRRRYELDQSPFYCLKSKARLAQLLRVSLAKLNRITTLSEELYLERDYFDEKREKSRRVEEPKPNLKYIQKRIEDILKRIQLPNYVHAPTKGRSYISNANAHINAKFVRSLDIEKYFPSTPGRRVYWFFHNRMKCSVDVAAILTKILIFKDHLPTGSPSSPILSYFAHLDMWEAIHKIVKDGDCNLTVYMDDVTVSGDHVPDKLIWKIKEEFRRCGLHSNNKKEKCYANQNSYEITGIIVAAGGELKIPNRQHLKIHKIRQEIQSENNPEKLNKLRQSLQGLESQALQVSRYESSHGNEH
jgi:retron-type reverse transcriptase